MGIINGHLYLLDSLPACPLAFPVLTPAVSITPTMNDQSCLDYTETTARRSACCWPAGVKQAKLDEIAAWTLQAHQAMATQPPSSASSAAPSAPSAVPSSSAVNQASARPPDSVPSPQESHKPTAAHSGTTSSSRAAQPAVAPDHATTESAHANLTGPTGHREEAEPVQGRLHHVQVDPGLSSIARCMGTHAPSHA